MKRKMLLITIVTILASSALFACGSKESVEYSTGNSSLENTGAKDDTDADSALGGDESIDIYKEYFNIVSQADTDKWDGFALIDLDGDGVNELFATCIEGEREDPGIQPYMIVGYNADGAVKNEELQDGVAGAGGYRGNLYYLEGKGILHESMVFAPFGVPADSIYAIKDGSIEIRDMGEFVLDSANIPEDGEWNPLEYGSWTWNGENLSEEEYNNKVNEATDNTEGLPMSEIDWKSKDEILKELEK